MKRIAAAGAAQSSTEAAQALLGEAQRIFSEDIEINHAIGRAGAALVPEGACVMTHCNAGALATAGHGTALGIIRSARDQGAATRALNRKRRAFIS